MRRGSSSSEHSPTSLPCSSGVNRLISLVVRSGWPRFPGQVATLGLVALINLTAVLSISIGLINLFPIPLLDGGHLVFYAVEAVRGRPLSDRAQDIGFRIGFAAIVMLMIFATWNDIIHLSSL